MLSWFCRKGKSMTKRTPPQGRDRCEGNLYSAYRVSASCHSSSSRRRLSWIASGTRLAKFAKSSEAKPTSRHASVPSLPPFHSRGPSLQAPFHLPGEYLLNNSSPHEIPRRWIHDLLQLQFSDRNVYSLLCENFANNDWRSSLATVLQLCLCFA